MMAVKDQLSWLFGNWKGEGNGSYSTIKSFKYYEEVEFCDHGFPFVCYKASSWTVQRDKPMHWESGFLRFNNDKKTVSLMVAHNFGVAGVMEGEVNLDRKELQLTSNKATMLRSSVAKNIAVIEEKRVYKLIDANKMELKLFMATEEQPLELHLCITYDRVSDQVKT